MLRKKFQQRVWPAASLSVTLQTVPFHSGVVAQNWKSEEIASKWSKGGDSHPPHFPFLTKPRFSRIPVLLLSFFREKGSLNLDLSCFPHHSSGKQATWAGPVRGRLGMPGGNPSISVPQTWVGKHVALGVSELT